MLTTTSPTHGPETGASEKFRLSRSEHPSPDSDAAASNHFHLQAGFSSESQRRTRSQLSRPCEIDFANGRDCVGTQCKHASALTNAPPQSAAANSRGVPTEVASDNCQRGAIARLRASTRLAHLRCRALIGAPSRKRDETVMSLQRPRSVRHKDGSSLPSRCPNDRPPKGLAFRANRQPPEGGYWQGVLLDSRRRRAECKTRGDTAPKDSAGARPANADPDDNRVYISSCCAIQQARAGSTPQITVADNSVRLA